MKKPLHENESGDGSADIARKVVRGFSSESVQRNYLEMSRRGLWKSEESLIGKYFSPGSSVLDIGCGSGRTTFPLMRAGYRVIGVDLTPAMIASAKRLAEEFRMDADVRVGDATSLEFPDGSFDNALFSFNGWNQIPGKMNRQKALTEARRVLRPGGIFIFSSHIRALGPYTLYWIQQWLRTYVLRPLGFRVREPEFGDRFFMKAASGAFESEQYAHVPSLGEVLGQVREAGFHLEERGYRTHLAPEDAGLPGDSCMFFVCRKAP